MNMNRQQNNTKHKQKRKFDDVWIEFGIIFEFLLDAIGDRLGIHVAVAQLTMYLKSLHQTVIF